MENSFSIIEGGLQEYSNEEFFKCYKSELKEVNRLSFEELFSGYQTIKLITFSYNFAFLDKLLENFDYAEIIFGASFLVEKNKQQEYLAELFANIETIGKVVPKYPNLSRMLSEGCLEFRTPFGVLDHRKTYLLKADDGRTRVIKPSANASFSAWNNEHIENYDYDDTDFCYNENVKDFETMWEFSQPIPFESFVSTTKKNGQLQGDIIIKKIKEKNEVMVLQQVDPPMTYENVKYTIDKNIAKENYKEILADVKLEEKNGVVKITSKIVDKIEHNKKKLFQKKVEFKNVEKPYPELTYDLYKNECYIDGEPVDLTPTKEEVKNDIDELLGIFNNFNQFVGDTDKLKKVHFKLINAIFCSPFHAKLRCAIKIRGKSSPSALPLFTLVSSETSNSGKTFMINATLKMMTGKELDNVKASDFSKDNIRNAQLAIKGTPFFIDEVDNSYISRIKDIIKNPDGCENNQIEEMPMLVFASNDVLKPDESIRKRMVFFTIDGALPSTIDKTAYESRGKSIIKRLGTGFYREYTRRMINKVREEMDYIIHSNEIPNDYYSDLMAISSDVILSIFEDYGYEIPYYMSHLTWNKDYSIDSNADNVIKEIEEFYKNNKKSCYFTKDKIIIEIGNNTNSKKKIDSWKNILPAEMKAKVQPTRDCIKLIIDRKEFEKKIGYRLGAFFSLRKGK